MEFKYTNYEVRLILNPSDIIVRFEHTSSHRIWEQTFTARDFIEFQSFGGVEFVGHILGLALKSASTELRIADLEESVSVLAFSLIYTNTVLPKPVSIRLSLNAVRKASAGADIEAMNRKLNMLMDRVLEMGQRAGGYVVLPGCPFAIPENIQELFLLKWGVAIDRNVQHINDYSSWLLANSDHVGVIKGVYHQQGITSLENLKYLTACGKLVIVPHYTVSDYSPIGTMKNLTDLTICCSTGQERCTLNDISWISELKNLRFISFNGCIVKDISPLSSLPNLHFLDVRNTGINNTACIGSRVNIQK